MALLEEFDEQGNFLFRWRSYVPSVIIGLSIFYIKDSTYINGDYFANLGLIVFFFLISLFGLFIIYKN